MTEVLEKYNYLIIAVVSVAELFLAVFTISGYVKNRKKTLYSYRNAELLTGSYTLIFVLIYNFFRLLDDYSSNIGKVYAFVSGTAQVASLISIFLLPIMILFFFFMGISNIVLIRHEGRNINNVLGSFFGFFIVVYTILAIFGWDVVYQKIIFQIYARGYQWITIVDYGIQNFLIFLICYLECLFISISILSIKAARKKSLYDKDYVIILGCAISKEGQPYPLLRGRIDKALEFSKKQFDATGKQIKFVPSGGKGSDEVISEAEAIRNYLISQGVDKSLILMEDKSVNTKENMEFSKAIVEADGSSDKVLFSTSNYHVFRSGVYADEAGLNAQGIGSKTKWYFWPNAFIREFIALLVRERKSHIIVTICLFLISAFIGYIAHIYVN